MLRTKALTVLGMSFGALAIAQVISIDSAPDQKLAAVIPIEGEINGITTRSITRRMDRAQSEGVDIAVIRLNTPGGLLRAALDISEAIKSAKNIHTVAYVDKEAYSAGALIALACNEIIIKERGVIGDCAPILPGGKLEGTEREKAESPTRTEFRDSAKRHGYNELLSQAMVSRTISVYKIEHRQTGEIRYVDDHDVKQLSDYDSQGSGRGRKDWKYIKPVVDSTELLTMTAEEAKEYGFAKAIVSSDSEAQAYLGISSWQVWRWDWGERMAGFLNSMAVTGILTGLGLLALYIALKTPGFAVPEFVAIACFAIIFGSKYLAGIAEWWTIALFLIGVILLLVEILVLPGFGIAGVAGGLCVIIGMLGMIMPADPGNIPLPHTPVAWDMFWGYLQWLIGAFFVSIVVAILLAKYLPRMPMLGTLVLVEAPAASGVDASAPPDLAPGVDVGQLGVAIGSLHPAGQVRIGEATVDVVSEGDLIDAGTQVEVIRREGNRIVVRRKA